VSTHRPLADAILRELRAVEVPVLSVTFAANDPAASVMPMDWATLIPLWYMGRAPEVPVVVMAPSRDLDAGQHVRAGHALAAAARAAGRRVAVIASADQGHAHDSAGPYGYDATSAEFDSRTADVIRAGDLSEFARFDPDWVRRAKADSWWQMLVLAGALGPGWRSELLSYEVPTYYGMLCAAFTRAHTPARDPA
jgi:aromatic ring-opening dioxygenase LigB subunit